MSEIDKSSGLHPFAHNGSLSKVAGSGGFWNDMDILEVGNGVFAPKNDSDTTALNQARAHFSMWYVL